MVLTTAKRGFDC